MYIVARHHFVSDGAHKHHYVLEYLIAIQKISVKIHLASKCQDIPNMHLVICKHSKIQLKITEENKTCKGKTSKFFTLICSF